MGHTVDYYLAPQSPWTYLGHQRFADMVHRTGSVVRVRPMDLGKVFPVSGGLPLGQRAPQRLAYRLTELARFRDHLGVPLNLQPTFFPVAGDPAARLIVAADMALGADAAMKVTGAVLKACWAEERNIADAQVLEDLLREQGLPTNLIAHSQLPEVQARYDGCTQAAIDAGVFGSPSYVIRDEIFWGQDRLDFVERALTQM